MSIMTATKMLTYANRRLQPGEDFEARSQRDVKVLLATRKAKVKRPEADVPAPPPEVEKRIVAVVTTNEAPVEPSVTSTSEATIEPKVETAGDDLASLRKTYEDLSGKRVYNGWDAAQLREKIAALGS